MVLTGRLSNQDLTTLFQRLTARDWKQAPRRLKKSVTGSADGRRRFGTVSSAIIEVLERVDRGLQVADIHVEVERRLEGPVARSSTATAAAALSDQCARPFREQCEGLSNLHTYLSVTVESSMRTCNACSH